MDKKYINAEVLKNNMHKCTWVHDMKCVEKFVDMLPAADVVSVVRCGDCKYQDKGENDCEAWNLCGYRPWLYIPTEDDAFCSKGERKDG